MNSPKAHWQAILGPSHEELPQALLLRGTRNLERQYEAYRAWFEKLSRSDRPTEYSKTFSSGDTAGCASPMHHILMTDAEKDWPRALGNQAMIDLALAAIRNYLFSLDTIDNGNDDARIGS